MDKKLQFIEEYKKSSNASSGSKYDANANIITKNIATLTNEINKKDMIELNRSIMCKYLGNSTYLDDLKSHIIYSHDETSIFPYCCSISLYPFILNGLTGLGGMSSAPKHANSFIGGLSNLIFLVAGQFAGAVAIPEFLTYFDHFLRKDFGKGYLATHGKDVENWFQQLIYTLNEPASARGYQSCFTNIAYFDKYYFDSIFKDFIFPDGDEPCWETTKELQKFFMKWFNVERTKTVLTFPVETANLLVENGKYKDEEMADFFAQMLAEGHSFFIYQSDSVDSLASCCFSGEQKILARSCTRGESKIYYDTFENIGKTFDGPDRKQFEVFHNGSWCKGKKIKLPNRPMYKITTTNNKEIIVSDNHLNPTANGNKKTTDLTVDDYLLFNNRELQPCPDYDLHLTYEQGFAVGAFLGDGSFGSEENGQIYEINYSQNIDKYAGCIENVNKANKQLGGANNCHLNSIYNNVLPIRIRSKELTNFIIKWTNWKRGTLYYNKELNLECLLQSIEFRKGILDGWYNTDGGNSNRCYTTSKKLVECMEIIATSLGLNTIINISDRTNEKVLIRDKQYNRNYPLYCLRWYNSKNKRSVKDIYKIINNSIYFKIKSIEKIEYKDDIYCFEMENTDEPYFTLPNGIITHNCRLKNGIEENEFSYTLGAGGIMTGSKKVITLNINRIVQNWYGQQVSLSEYLTPIVNRVHNYLEAYNNHLWDLYNNDLLTVYKNGFIDLDKQYLTIGINGLVEAAEFLKIDINSKNEDYRKFVAEILETIKKLNKVARSKHCKFNTEMVPAENLGVKFYNWDKKDGYKVPENRNCYNSYFYKVEDEKCNAIEKIYLQGKGFTTCLDGGAACHINLDEHLSEKQYRMLMDIAITSGCNYFTFNIPNTICNECGHISKNHLDHCEKCGSKNIDYITRIIGYLRRISNFSEARQIEASKRYYDKIS